VSTTVIVWVLTVLAAVAVVLTRLRLRGDRGAGRFSISPWVLHVHFVAGIVALVLWVSFLVAPDESAMGSALVGILAIGAWWVTALCGLLILARWLPPKGRHVTGVTTDAWSEGPGLSVLAHGGMLVGVTVFTYAYLTTTV
jgi:hypothetical protein